MKYNWNIEMAGTKRQCLLIINKQAEMPPDVSTYLKAAISKIKLIDGNRIRIKSFGHRPMVSTYFSLECNEISIIRRHGRSNVSGTHGLLP